MLLIGCLYQPRLDENQLGSRVFAHSDLRHWWQPQARIGWRNIMVLCYHIQMLKDICLQLIFLQLLCVRHQLSKLIGKPVPGYKPQCCYCHGPTLSQVCDIFLVIYQVGLAPIPYIVWHGMALSKTDQRKRSSGHTIHKTLEGAYFFSPMIHYHNFCHGRNNCFGSHVLESAYKDKYVLPPHSPQQQQRYKTHFNVIEGWGQ